MKNFFFLPSFLLKRPFFIKCNYGVNLYLPLKIILGWGILFTGRIHPVETEIIEKIYRSNRGNIILLGGYRDGWFNLALNKIVKKIKKKVLF